MSTDETIIERFKSAAKDGKIQWVYAFSPKDTLADTRYVIIVNGETRQLMHNEANGFLAGMGY